ncbi:MAG: NFACT RNA binding domain-containing protein [Bilophila wadsworthia]
MPKNVQPFRSSDGFLLLRGRDAKGNAQLLKLAAPHDLWMHTGGGPGAHILIRRDHAAQEIPSRTISEAAILSVLKSWRTDETQVDVIAALAKFVHPIRGAKPGTVRIDRMEPAIIVTLTLRWRKIGVVKKIGEGRNFLRKFLPSPSLPLQRFSSLSNPLSRLLRLMTDTASNLFSY